MKLRLLSLLLLAAGVSSLSSCLPLAAGAAAGYMVRDQGYTVQSPLTKE